jgi:hypothetical protein
MCKRELEDIGRALVAFTKKRRQSVRFFLTFVIKCGTNSELNRGEDGLSWFIENKAVSGLPPTNPPDDGQSIFLGGKPAMRSLRRPPENRSGDIPGDVSAKSFKGGDRDTVGGGYPGDRVIAVIVIGKAKSAINPGVERCNPGVDPGLMAFNPGVKSGLNRVSPLDLGLTMFSAKAHSQALDFPSRARRAS